MASDENNQPLPDAVTNPVVTPEEVAAGKATSEQMRTLYQQFYSSTDEDFKKDLYQWVRKDRACPPRWKDRGVFVLLYRFKCGENNDVTPVYNTFLGVLIAMGVALVTILVRLMLSGN